MESSPFSFTKRQRKRDREKIPWEEFTIGPAISCSGHIFVFFFQVNLERERHEDMNRTRLIARTWLNIFPFSHLSLSRATGRWRDTSALKFTNVQTGADISPSLPSSS